MFQSNSVIEPEQYNHHNVTPNINASSRKYISQAHKASNITSHNDSYIERNPNEPDIGDIPLTMKIIKTNGYSLNQIFESHRLIDGHYVCKICTKRIYDRISFLSHLRIHTGDWVGRCSKCNRGFSRKAHLINHDKICNFKEGDVSIYEIIIFQFH